MVIDYFRKPCFPDELFQKRGFFYFIGILIPFWDASYECIAKLFAFNTEKKCQRIRNRFALLFWPSAVDGNNGKFIDDCSHSIKIRGDPGNFNKKDPLFSRISIKFESGVIFHS